jgi:hypothetical protein
MILRSDFTNIWEEDLMCIASLFRLRLIRPLDSEVRRNQPKNSFVLLLSPDNQKLKKSLHSFFFIVCGIGLLGKGKCRVEKGRSWFEGSVKIGTAAKPLQITTLQWNIEQKLLPYPKQRFSNGWTGMILLEGYSLSEFTNIHSIGILITQTLETCPPDYGD